MREMSITASPNRSVARLEVNRLRWSKANHHNAPRCQALDCENNISFSSTEGFCLRCYAKNKKATNAKEAPIARKPGKERKRSIAWVSEK